jgi:hypothetical protein
VTSSAAPLGVCVGITNTRLGAARRGIAVELALRVAAAAGTTVCLVAADPTDRDVERRLPQLAAGDEEYTQTRVQRGVHTLDVTFLPAHRLCVVGLSDRAGVESVLPELRRMFEYVIVDAPSRVSRGGVGIAGVLLPLLDMLLVVSALTADELALTRIYVDALEEMVGAGHVEVRVASTGEPADGGLAHEQLERRLAALPMIGATPQLWGRVTHETVVENDDLDRAFRPIVDWIVASREARRGPAPSSATAVRTPMSIHHLATARYREDFGDHSDAGSTRGES